MVWVTTRIVFASFPPLVRDEVTLRVPDERVAETCEALELLAERTGLTHYADAKIVRD